MFLKQERPEIPEINDFEIKETNTPKNIRTFKALFYNLRKTLFYRMGAPPPP